MGKKTDESSERMFVVYIAGPFRATTQWDVTQNIRRAEETALHVWRCGYVALCPHLNTQNFEGMCEDAMWLRGGLELMRRCDAVLIVPTPGRDFAYVGQRCSEGVIAEIELAEQLGIPVCLNMSSLYDAYDAYKRRLASNRVEPAPRYDEVWHAGSTWLDGR